MNEIESKVYLIVSQSLDLTLMVRLSFFSWFSIGLWHLPFMWSACIGYAGFSIAIFPFAADPDAIKKLDKAINDSSKGIE